MTTQPQLSVFISSKMSELAPERKAVQAALSAYRLQGWLWETDAGARPEPIRSTYLAEVEACDIYLGLFWLGYGQYTIDEYEHARAHNKPCLVYDKYVETEKRDPRLEAFLANLQKVESPTGLTVCRFEKPERLAQQVQTDVMRLLTSVFKESRKQPIMEVTAEDHSIAIGNNYGSGSVIQNNYGDSRKRHKSRN